MVRTLEGELWALPPLAAGGLRAISPQITPIVNPDIRGSNYRRRHLQMEATIGHEIFASA